MQYVELIESLIDRGVRFIVVGGVAVVLHGVPRATFDLDLLLDLETTNVRTFVDIMLAHGLAPRAPVDPYELANPVTRAQWVSEKHLRAFSFFEPRGGAVDVLLSAPIDYAGASVDAVEAPMGKSRVRFASIAALITMKRAADRGKDRLDIEALELILQLDLQLDEEQGDL